ncbi:uncharacterized protein [Antedon mediterranea]|uniref:uncharacterized protein n=1 Tax=Antedon mediterranea TaxID=105859 RepID=UPI003AF7FFC2
MSKEKWQATAKVLVIGYKQESFFPFKLAVPFLQYVMDATIINSNHPSMIPTFLELVADSEKIVLETALNNFSDVDEEDLFDILDNYKVKRNATSDNIRAILQDAAHRTLIQGTSYISRCWHSVFVEHLKPVLHTMNIEDICQTAIPTTRRVIAALNLPQDASEEQRNTTKLLLKFIKSLSVDKLMTFMRYTTGANQMLGKKITVRYVQQSDFERRPVAHTCGCILELASSFKDYIEFRSEFSAVLENNIWVMDIV